MSEGFDRDAARARCEAATEGPWFKSEVVAEAPQATIRTRFLNRPIVRVTANEVEASTDYDGSPAACVANADFIAHARTDLPACLAALDAAEAERDEARALIRQLDKALRVCAEVPWDAPRGIVAAATGIAEHALGLSTEYLSTCEGAADVPQ